MQLKKVEQVRVELVRDWLNYKAGEVRMMYPGEADAMERFGNGRILGKRTTADGGQIDNDGSGNRGAAAAGGGEKAPRNRSR